MEEIIQSLLLAERELSFAQEELRRPSEDVVTLSACQLVRASMKHIMRLYLMAQGVEWNHKMSFDDLMKSCIKTNRSFSKINVSEIECKNADYQHCDHKYCLSVDNVSGCLTAAKELRDIVWTELKINHK